MSDDYATLMDQRNHVVILTRAEIKCFKIQPSARE